VDIRSSGESVLPDEYLPQEQEDALEVLAWIAAQPWCTGDAGMFGISWGGFNGLQVAAHAPPQLKAVISLCSTVDRYADDVHYRGGSVLALEMLSWAASMFRSTRSAHRLAGPEWARCGWSARFGVDPYEHECLPPAPRRLLETGPCARTRRSRPITPSAGGRTGTGGGLRLVEGLGAPSKASGPWSHAFLRREPGPRWFQECPRW
jgi:pimeloyl-ACP methyl ester carboxylesterase